jgi:hypothetical protein
LAILDLRKEFTMFRKVVGVGLVLSLLCGCQESHRPVVREVRPQLEDKGESPVNPHAQMQKSGPAAPAPTGPEVDLGQARLTAPAAWVRKAPRVEFIRGEFTLPRAEGDAADGRITVTVAGGGLKENVDRWRTQFVPKPEKESQEPLKVDGVDVTLVDFSGTFNDQMGPFAPGAERPGYRMLGAIFDLGGQLYFIKAYGPAKTMAARAAEFRTFVQSLKVSKPAK